MQDVRICNEIVLEGEEWWFESKMMVSDRDNIVCNY